jgi:hypothetical protein
LIYDVVIVDDVEVKDHLVFDYRPPEVLKIGTFFFVNDVLQVSLSVSPLSLRRKALEGPNIPSGSSSCACECVVSCLMQQTCHQYLSMGNWRGRSKAVPV